MFDWLFKKRKKEPARNKTVEALDEQLIWLPQGHPDNPYPMEVLDCRPLALHFTSATTDPKVAGTFSSLRGSDGRNHIGQLPSEYLSVDCELRYLFNGVMAEGVMYRATVMEQKWDMYQYENRLYMARSWTGTLNLVAELDATPDSVIVRRIHASLPAVWGQSHFAVAQVHFLIATHLLRRLIPFQIPIDHPEHKPSIAFGGFNNFGRAAQFATREDITQLTV